MQYIEDINSKEVSVKMLINELRKEFNKQDDNTKEVMRIYYELMNSIMNSIVNGK